jgi:hypothetical protein
MSTVSFLGDLAASKISSDETNPHEEAAEECAGSSS